MDSKNIFDLFGRQKEEINIDVKTLELMKLLIEKRFKLLQSKFGEHVSQTQTLVNSIKVSKNNIDLKNLKRIVIVKIQFDDAVKSINDQVLTNHTSFKSEINSKIDEINARLDNF